VLAEESTVVLLASRADWPMSQDDIKRLRLAVSRIENAKRVLA
jgi:hypothetical protein